MKSLGNLPYWQVGVGRARCLGSCSEERRALGSASIQGWGGAEHRHSLGRGALLLLPFLREPLWTWRCPDSRVGCPLGTAALSFPFTRLCCSPDEAPGPWAWGGKRGLCPSPGGMFSLMEIFCLSEISNLKIGQCC